MLRLRKQAALWLVVVGILLISSVSAVAATTSLQSDEVGGASVAARLATQNLKNAWATQVTTNGGTAAPPITFSQPTYTLNAPIAGVINTAADGTTTSIERTRYSGNTNPVYIGPSTTPGTAVCTTAGTSLQGGAPRPTSLESNATCSTAAGFAYSEVGGAGESTTRDAVEFTFSRPVLGFGAWFGDLETRTDGSGVAAVVRLYGVGGVLLSDKLVTPGPSYLPQSNCGSAYTGCGNNTTRWLGFVADPALPVVRMVVIVGDDDAAGTGGDEGIGVIGPTLDLSTATISLAKSALPLTDTNADGVIGAGDTVAYRFAVTNTGTLAVSGVAITDSFATGLSCPTGSLASGAVRTCTGSHVMTQAEVNAGSLTNTATATATSYGGTITSNSSTLVVPITATPGLRVTKTTDTPTFDAVGGRLTYAVTVQNTGNVTLTALNVADSNPGTGAFSTTCNAISGSLIPGATRNCTATYTVTQADLDAGTVTNVATANAQAPGNVAVGPATDRATSSAVQRLGFTMQKAVDKPTYETVGEILTYTMSVTNSGNVTLTGTTLTDPAPGAGAFTSNCGTLATTLAPGQTRSCTATYAVTQDDLDAGTVVNLANAGAVGPSGPVTSPEATATSTVVERPGLSIVKTVDAATFDSVGDVLTYSIRVTNLSNVRVNTVRVADAAPGNGAYNLNCAALPNALNSGASGNCTATYAVTQADIDAGRVTNEAQASARLPTTLAVLSPVAAASSTAAQTAALSLVKTVEVDSYAAVGDVLTYSLVLTNSGNVTLTDADVADAAPGAGAFNLDCPDLPGTLAPSAESTCTATYAVTQDDVDSGSVTNVASATATSPGGDVSTPESSATVSAQQAPALSVAKTVDSAEFTRAGDVLNYDITVENIGNVTLTNVSVTDDPPGDGNFSLDCSGVPAVLAPGADGTCSARYVVTQTDVDDGSVSNVANADATAPAANISASSPAATSTSVGVASLDITKSVDLTTFDSIGQPLVYTIVVSNTGDVTLSSVAINDIAPGLGAFDTDCDDVSGSLAPGDDVTCTATYNVAQADLDAGTVTNVATVGADDPEGVALSPVMASATSRATQRVGLTLQKAVAEPTYETVGDVLTYTMAVTNSGNLTLTGLAVTDPAPGTGAFSSDCASLAPVLAPGFTATCTATYAVTQDDLDAGSVTNLANAQAVGPGGTVRAPQASATSTVIERPGLAIVKSVDAPTFNEVGDVLTYSITVTNAGSVRVTAVAVTDPAPGAGAFNLNCAALPNALNAGASGSCTATYAVTQADIDAGHVTNGAQASARLPSTLLVTSPRASANSAAEQTAALSLVKTADDDSYDAVGDVLNYTIAVANTGNVTLTDVAVTDAAPGTGAFNVNCPDLPGDLAPGDDTTCNATYTVTQGDLDAGSVTNVASATATSPGGDVSTPDSTAIVQGQQGPALEVTKTVDESEFTRVGDVLTYAITVENTGNVTLSDVVAADPAPGDGAFTLDCDGLPAVLAPGEDGTCTATYVVTQSDIDAGEVTNVASADASAPRGQLTATSPEVTSTAPNATSITISKSVDKATFDSVDQQLVYTIDVTNTGNVTLTSVVITDPNPGTGAFETDCDAVAGQLDPGATATCSATYTLTQQDLDAGEVLNSADVSADPPQGDPVTASDEASSLAVADRALTIEKTVAEKTFSKVGDVLNYTITTTNTGNVTLANVKVKDKAPGKGAFASTCGVITTLPPGDDSVCTATYTVTEKDLNESVTNTAKASVLNKVAAVTASATSKAKSKDAPGTGNGNGNGDGSGDGNGDGDGNGLPDSGAPDIRLPVALGVGLLLAGGLMTFVGWKRRRRFVRD